ncbi:SH3 domain-containing protein [Elizabethkingia meningoseptica]|uniref:SH3 domain-containing protein n=1 Tax=Elizabethkingia meningoseptica TaxID=238 RepID=UPI0023AFE760|nr:SH3 domain-containing protein [Elizabethkingia meningoseptica]MDE5432543.1 SH3 domain-containing protein [Elizabethkingia meningoseptica]
MIKMLFSLFTGLGLLIASYSPALSSTDHHNRGCTGSANCSACSNCSGCAHCTSGGTCGVCSGGSSGKRTYSSGGYSGKKTSGKRSGSKLYSSKSAIKGNKSPVYYYDSKAALTESNYLYTINRKVEVRKAPGDHYKVIEVLQPNSRLIFLDKEEKWYKIRVYKSGAEGFVHSKNIK